MAPNKARYFGWGSVVSIAEGSDAVPSAAKKPAARLNGGRCAARSNPGSVPPHPGPCHAASPEVLDGLAMGRESFPMQAMAVTQPSEPRRTHRMGLVEQETAECDRHGNGGVIPFPEPNAVDRIRINVMAYLRRQKGVPAYEPSGDASPARLSGVL